MKPITYLKGDATSPQTKGIKLIAHICNDLGGWGKGFVTAISKRWSKPEKAYRLWYRERAKNKFSLGAVQFIQVQPDIWIANMIGQHGMRTGSGGPPVRYEAIEECLAQVAEKAKDLTASVHMPLIGCGLAGGKWEKIEPIIQRQLSEREISIFVYDFD